MDGEQKIAVLTEEDVEEDPDRWCSSTECGQELWQIACQWVWNEAPLPWPCDAGRRTTRYRVGTAERTPARCLSIRPDTTDVWPPSSGPKGEDEARSGGVLSRCKTMPPCALRQARRSGRAQWRQENAFTQRAVLLASLEDGQACPLREHCLRPGAKGNRARRLSAVRRLLPAHPFASDCRSASHALARCGWPRPSPDLDCPTFASHLCKCFLWLKTRQGLLPHPALPVPFVLISAGVGRTDWHAMAGGAHRTCASPSPLCLLLWP